MIKTRWRIILNTFYLSVNKNAISLSAYNTYLCTYGRYNSCRKSQKATKLRPLSHLRTDAADRSG